MLNSQDRPIASKLKRIGQVAITALIAIILILPAPKAEANFFDTIKDIYHLPKDVENLQNQYEEAKKSYEETKQQVEAQKQQLETQSQQLIDQRNQLLESAQQAKEREEQLALQNKELQEHNNELQARLEVMEDTVSAKDKWIHRIKVISITLVSLVLLYFVIGRLFRVIIWRRSHKGAR